MDYFDIDKLQFDPDRTDVYDITSKLLPLLIRMGYVQLMHDKSKHDSFNWDPKDEGYEEFKFTTDELVDRVDNTVYHLRERLSDISTSDIIDAINLMKSEFKVPLKD